MTEDGSIEMAENGTWPTVGCPLPECQYDLSTCDRFSDSKFFHSLIEHLLSGLSKSARIGLRFFFPAIATQFYENAATQFPELAV